MFNVVLIHACNMKKMHRHHALYVHGRIACAGYGLFTSVGKWVVNSGKMGQSPK